VTCALHLSEKAENIRSLGISRKAEKNDAKRDNTELGGPVRRE
jgi:hypothetical protein